MIDVPLKESKSDPSNDLLKMICCDCGKPFLMHEFLGVIPLDDDRENKFACPHCDSEEIEIEVE